VVVLIGRTNAGKSTLFNRLTESRRAIVTPIENTTRDQNRGLVHWKGATFELVDTGGLDLTALDLLDQDIQIQAQRALEQAVAVIFVVDGKSDDLPQDMETALWLKRTNLPVVMCLNKADSVRIKHAAIATYAHFPFDQTIPCSAKNGVGTADLLDAVITKIPVVRSPNTIEAANIQLALIGQPNVGKSSLFNALIGEDRVIVSPLPHTTRDPNDTVLVYDQRTINVVDTAGLRRQNRLGYGTDKTIELLSTRGTKEAIRQADVVVLVIAAERKIVHQDKALIDYLQAQRKSFVLVANKWDLIPEKTPSTINDYLKYYQYHFQFATHVPVIFTSAVEQQRVMSILDAAVTIYDYQQYWLPQEQLDIALRQLRSLQPKEHRRAESVQPKRPLELTSLTQVGVKPVRFALAVPRPKNVATALVHRLEKMIRTQCSYAGVPIFISIVAKT
jgi:GTP-binding protein